jgi:predicted transcriptional regulator with HTH domain
MIKANQIIEVRVKNMGSSISRTQGVANRLAGIRFHHAKKILSLGYKECIEKDGFTYYAYNYQVN